MAQSGETPVMTPYALAARRLRRLPIFMPTGSCAPEVIFRHGVPDPGPQPVEPQHDWRAAVRRLEGAYANATLKGYRADFSAWETWALANGACVAPADPAAVAAFIAADAQTSSIATLRRRKAAIRKVHRLLGLPSPDEDELVNLAYRRARRSKPARPGQALGLTAPLRDQLIGACPDTLMGARDRAVLHLGYDTLCRRAELVAITCADIRVLESGGARVFIRRAKNDPFGEGRWASLSPAGLALVEAWLSKADIREGPIMQTVRGGRGAGRHLDALEVTRTVKRAARRAGVPAHILAGLSGHSMRVGAAQDLMARGHDFLQIMTAGGWTSTNEVGRYVREADFNIWTGALPGPVPRGSRFRRETSGAPLAGSATAPLRNVGSA